MYQLICRGRDGVERAFQYEVEKDEFEAKWHFRVFADPLPVSGNSFDLTVLEISPTKVQVTMISHNYEPAYTAKGIPEALLPAVAATLKKLVVSSPATPQNDSWRTVAAVRMWERLRVGEIATYDPATGVYTLT